MAGAESNPPLGDEERMLLAVDEALGFIDDPDSRAHIAMRFCGQYLKAYRAAQSPEALVRVWDSFRYYLTTPATKRKSFRLDWAEAGRAIEVLRRLVQGDS